MSTPVCRASVALVVIGLAAGCRGERTERVSVSSAGVGIVSRDSTRALGPGDIRIVSVDSSVELALIGDSVVTGLADKALAKVKEKTDPAAVTGSGFAASIEKAVKSSVQSALSKQVTFPVSSISDVRYENGTLELYDNRGKRTATFGGSSSGSAKTMFSQTDADAFIQAFKRRKNPP